MKPIVKNSLLFLLAVLFFGDTFVLSALPEPEKWIPTSVLIVLIILIITIASIKSDSKELYNTFIKTSVIILTISATLSAVYSLYLTWSLYQYMN